MNRRAAILVAILLAAGIYAAYGSPAPQSTRKVINAPQKQVDAPYSDAILAGNTLYIAGKIGLDPKIGKPPAAIEDEIKLLLDNEKATLAQAGMTMDDLVYVQVFCSDLSLYEKFNGVYRSYFGKDLPARAFIGAGSLLRGGHFELQAIAVKR